RQCDPVGCPWPCRPRPCRLRRLRRGSRKGRDEFRRTGPSASSEGAQVILNYGPCSLAWQLFSLTLRSSKRTLALSRGDQLSPFLALSVDQRAAHGSKRRHKTRVENRQISRTVPRALAPSGTPCRATVILTPRDTILTLWCAKTRLKFDI